MNISQPEILRDIEISCRKRAGKREMYQNVLWEENVSLEYEDERWALLYSWQSDYRR